MKKMVLLFSLVAFMSVNSSHAFVARCAPFGVARYDDDILVYNADHLRQVFWYQCHSGSADRGKYLIFNLEINGEYELGLQAKHHKLNGFVLSCPTVSKRDLLYSYGRSITFLKAEASAAVGTGLGVGFDDHGNPCVLIRGGIAELGARAGVVRFDMSSIDGRLD